MSKKTKRLKKEIKQLHKDIGELIRDPNSIESLGIQFRYQFRQDFIKMIMYGTVVNNPVKSRIIGEYKG